MMTTLLMSTLMMSAAVTAPAVVLEADGVVEAKTGEDVRKVRRYDQLAPNTTISTKGGARAEIRLASGTLLRVGPNSSIVLSRMDHRTPVARRKVRLKVVVGSLWAKVTSLFGSSEDDASFEVETDNAVAGVRGTSFWVEAGGSGERFVLEEGKLTLQRNGETVGEPIVLDHPGATAEALGELIQSLPDTPPDQRAAMQQQVGGLAAVISFQLAGSSLPGIGDGSFDPSRQIFVGPENLTDTTFDGANPGTGGLLGIDLVPLDVTLRLPP